MSGHDPTIYVAAKPVSGYNRDLNYNMHKSLTSLLIFNETYFQ